MIKRMINAQKNSGMMIHSMKLMSTQRIVLLPHVHTDSAARSQPGVGGLR